MPIGQGLITDKVHIEMEKNGTFLAGAALVPFEEAFGLLLLTGERRCGEAGEGGRSFCLTDFCDGTEEQERPFEQELVGVVEGVCNC